MLPTYQREDSRLLNGQFYTDTYIKILMQKDMQQDKRFEALEKKLINIDTRVNELEKFRDNVDNKKYKKESYLDISENMIKKAEQNALTNDIINEVEELIDNDDMRDQIHKCRNIADKTLKLLKLMPKQNADNYRKNLVHLFYQAIRRNYARTLFTKGQIEVLIQLMRESQNKFVSEDRYFEYDEIMYNYDLEVFPVEG